MIGRLHASGKTAAEIFKILKPTVSRSGVYKVIQRFKNTGSYLPKVRSTPPRPVRTPKLINAIRSKLNRNPQRSARKMPKEVNVSHMTIQNVLKKDLKCLPYKKVKKQLLSGAKREKRLARALLLLQRLADCTQPTVLWTDEKLFTVQAVHNAQNDRVWRQSINKIPEKHRISFQRQKPSSVMVWAGVTSSGHKTPLVFIQEGVKINQHIYLSLLKDTVVPWKEKTFGDAGVTLQQDGATSHSAKTVQAFCKQHFKGFWSKELWPPSSPNLNPMDYSIWSILESKACAMSHTSVDSLKRKLVKCWDEIDSETVRTACTQITRRLKQVVKARGGYFE